MRAFWLERGWYLAFWCGWLIAGLAGARVCLVNPILKAIADLKP